MEFIARMRIFHPTLVKIAKQARAPIVDKSTTGVKWQPFGKVTACYYRQFIGVTASRILISGIPCTAIGFLLVPDSVIGRSLFPASGGTEYENANRGRRYFYVYDRQESSA